MTAILAVARAISTNLLFEEVYCADAKNKYVKQFSKNSLLSTIINFH